jgi:hypothetical protein
MKFPYPISFMDGDDEWIDPDALANSSYTVVEVIYVRMDTYQDRLSYRMGDKRFLAGDYKATWQMFASAVNRVPSGTSRREILHSDHIKRRRSVQIRFLNQKEIGILLQSELQLMEVIDG